MAEAVWKDPAVSLSLFLEMSDLEIEAELTCMSTLFLGRSWKQVRE